MIDGRVLLFALALSILTGVIFGLAPALSASKTNLVEALKEGSRGSTGGARRNRIRNALVVTEIAISVFLLAGAGLLLRSFLRLSAVDPGYDYHGAMTIDLAIRSGPFPTDADVVQYRRRASEELSAIPGVSSVGAANHLPLGNSETAYTFEIVGRPPFPPGQTPDATFIVAAPEYFETMRIPLLVGRTISERDTASSPKVLVVSRSFAQRFLAGENPIGKQIEIGDGEGVRTIVGVVGDTRFVSLVEQPRPAFYVAHAQKPSRRLQFVIRAANAEHLGPAARAAVRKIDPEQPILAIRTLETMRSEAIADRRFVLVLIGGLALLAVTLAAVGIYSIMSYSVAQRTPEIGIRMSLGAQAGDVLRLILGQSLRLIALGVAIGVAVSLAATRVMATLLYGVTPTDPATFASICIVIGLVGLFASYIPANRATRVDPLVAIRYD